MPWRGILENGSKQKVFLRKALNAADRSFSVPFGLSLGIKCCFQSPMAPGLIIRREEGQAEFSGDYHLSQSSPTREVPNGHRHENGHVDDFELLQPDKMDPIAVVGLALRFPQDASSPEAFWQMLLEGRSALTDVPKDRYHVDAFYKASATKSGTASSTKLILPQHMIAHE